MKTWTDAENKFLRKAYNNEPIAKIAKALMRSEQSIRNHVHILRKKGFAFDRVRDVTERSVSQNMMDDLEPIGANFNHQAEKDFFKGEKWAKKYHQPQDRFDEHMDYSGAFESDVEEYEPDPENIGFEGLPLVEWPLDVHPTEYDESDDIEAAKRLREERLKADQKRKIQYALYNPVDNA